jgi:mono/diheme cytochrome c family protein
MNIRFFLLISMVGFVAACGESKSPAPSTAPVETPAAAAPATAPAPAQPSPAAVGSAPPANEPAPSTTAPVAQPINLAARKLDPEKIKRGEAVYRANCASCHGANGEATPGWRTPGADGRYPPPPLDGSAHAWHHSTETLEKMIREGSPGPGGMPPWDGKLTNQQIDDVIVWMKSLWPDDVYEVWFKEIEHKPQPKQN